MIRFLIKKSNLTCLTLHIQALKTHEVKICYKKKKPTDKLLSIRAPRGISHGTPWDDTLSTSSLRKDEILYFFQEIL